MQELKADISSLEESRKTEKEAYETLKEEHDALTKQLEEKKVKLNFTEKNKRVYMHAYTHMYVYY